MQKFLDSAPAAGQNLASVSDLFSYPAHKRRESIPLQHTPPRDFIPGQTIEIAIVTPREMKQGLNVHLYYRHVNQAERYQVNEMRLDGNRFSFTVPADYTNSTYPLQYYFEVRGASDAVWLYPGLQSNLQEQPYFVLRSDSSPRGDVKRGLQ